MNIEKTHKGKQIDSIKAYVIEAFNKYFTESSDKNEILDFVKAQLDSKSPKTRKLAKEFLKKNEKNKKYQATSLRYFVCARDKYCVIRKSGFMIPFIFP